MTKIDLKQVCSMILSKLGFSDETLSSLIDKWRCFVEECEEGYQWNFSEYKNEIRVRYLIQNLMDDEKLSKGEEFKEVFAEIEKLDQRFKALLQPNIVIDKGDGWWDKSVLNKAGYDYCQYMYDVYGVIVENVDEK
ncbi:hypothetical protein SG34_006285 [Thalassomonas viridans]|uniref:Uncharacterized protein n=1 Tax=Thalassomonas viridans TaxID=137584 RepID=A0AAF0CBC0_9GAMM|nr:hypothetical protein [Thalassomonas viridans]WDE06524.1 hypothetical protein SG34_006285 [Thalassomonas viridans]